VEVGAIEGTAGAGEHGPSRIPEELLPLRPPPVRAGHPGARVLLAAVVVLALGGAGALLIRAKLASPADTSPAEAMTDARYAATAIETFALQNGGSYAGATPTGLMQINPSVSDSIEVAAVSNSYRITVRLASGAEFNVVRGPNGSTEHSCQPLGIGACPATGAWE
jgi:hypothetical protein